MTIIIVDNIDEIPYEPEDDDTKYMTLDQLIKSGMLPWMNDDV